MKKSLLLFGALLFITLLTLFVLILTTKKPLSVNTARNIAVLSPAPASFTHNYTTLYFDPASLSLVAGGQNQNLNLFIDTGQNTVVGTELSLKFNSALVEVVSISPGGFFDKPIVLSKKIDNKNGIINYALSSLTPKMGKGNLLTLIVRGKASGQTRISFGDTQIAAQKEDAHNVLKEAKSALLEVK